MVKDMALGHAFLRLFRFSPLGFIYPMFLFSSFYYRSYHKNKRAKPGNLETKQCFL